MSSRRLASLMSLGIVIGAVPSLVHGWPVVMGRGYLRQHLYNTAMHTVMPGLDRRVVIATLLCCAIWAVLAVHARLRGKVKLFYTSAVVSAALVVLCVETSLAERIVKMLSGYDTSIIMAALSNGVPQIAASIVLVVIGVFILRRLRKASPKESNSQFLTGVRKLWWRFGGFGRLLERQTVLILIPLILFCASNALYFGLRVASASSAKANPNIVFIMVDTLRADHLGCYGYSRNTTPNIDRFSRDGMRFSKAISQAPWTTASVASFMSGRLLRIRNTGPVVTPLPRNIPHLQLVLKDQGYTTAAIVSNPYVGKANGFDRGYDYFRECYDNDIGCPDVASGAESILKKIKDKRFFLFLLFIDPHSPYFLHDEHNYYPGYKGKLGKKIDVRNYDPHKWSDDDVQYAKALYDSEIRYTDDYVGMVLDSLRRMNLYNDTLVVFLSDHGEGFKEHGKLDHMKTVYDELLSVPLIIKLPGSKRGSVVHGTFSMLNLMPTILNYVHRDTSHLRLQGNAVKLQGLQSVRASTIYSSTHASEAHMECLRAGSMKYIHDILGKREELYDVEKDPGEHHNLAGSQKDTVAGFRKMLHNEDKEIDQALNIPGEQNTGEFNVQAFFVKKSNQRNDQAQPGFSNKEQNRLKSLGYLQ